AKVMAKLLRDASVYLNQEISQAVVSIPSSFGFCQCQKIIDIGSACGVEVIRCIQDPTSIAMAYGLNEPKEGNFLFLDVGGGHCSVSLLEIGGNVFEVLATRGSKHLGGNAFTQKIIGYIETELERVDLFHVLKDIKAKQFISDAAEQAKCDLSSVREIKISLPFLSIEDSEKMNLRLTSHQYEYLCLDLIEQCKSLIKNVISDAKISEENISEVVLTGGAARSPLFSKFISKLIGKNVNQLANFEGLVGLGAAIEAGVMTGHVKDCLRLSVSPHSWSIEIPDNKLLKVINRNTILPTKRSDVLSTTFDGQTQLNLHILQGEDSTIRDNKSVGVYLVEDIMPAPKGIPQVEVSFSISDDGMSWINIDAKEKQTGRSLSTRFYSGKQPGRDLPVIFKPDATNSWPKHEKASSLKGKYAKNKNPVVAALLSFFLLGVGQLYNGDYLKGIAIIGGSFIVQSLSLSLFLVPIAVFAMYDAYTVAKGARQLW
ncbi:MAG: Hsp70 family protein, partial [Cyanobacteria bacterium J06649_11]